PPQQYTSPAAVRPHVASSPLAISVKVSPPATGSGDDVTESSPGLPSWPRSFAPQQYACPALVSAHVWREPARMRANRVAPETSTGAMLQGLDSPPSITQVSADAAPS